MSKNKRFVVPIVCSLFFGLFSFSSLFLMHDELLRCACEGWGGESGNYSSWATALSVTCFLWLMQWGVNFITRFRGKWLAVSFFPAYLALAMLTSLQPVMDEQEFVLQLSAGWWWGIVALVIYGGVAYVYRQKETASRHQRLTGNLLMPNLLVMTLFTYSAGCLGNDDELLNHELAIAQSISDERYEDARQVGKKSLANSRTLSALRAFALSKTDSLGQCLFCYPQSQGAAGLFMDESKGRVSPLANRDIYDYLGGDEKLDNETPVRYFRRLCAKDSGSAKAIDYYLCSLLLERQLEPFAQALDTYYKGRTLPRHYQEALVLLVDKEGDAITSSLAGSCTPHMKQGYESFKALQKEYLHDIPRRNYSRRQYGDTYWWYYWYGE